MATDELQALRDRVTALEQRAFRIWVPVDTIIESTTPYKRLVNTAADVRMVLTTAGDLWWQWNVGTRTEPTWATAALGITAAGGLAMGGTLYVGDRATFAKSVIFGKGYVESFTNAASSLDVDFTNRGMSDEPDTAYVVLLSVTVQTGTPPATIVPRVTTWSTSGFTITLSEAPGTGNGIFVPWLVYRYPT